MQRIYINDLKMLDGDRNNLRKIRAHRISRDEARSPKRGSTERILKFMQLQPLSELRRALLIITFTGRADNRSEYRSAGTGYLVAVGRIIP